MEAQLNAAPTPAEENDDRYVAICSRIKVRGEALREKVFQAIEADDIQAAFEHLDAIQKIDRAYMLSLQKGMGIHEARKKKILESRDEAAKAAIAERLAAEAASPERRSLFSKIFNR